MMMFGSVSACECDGAVIRIRNSEKVRMQKANMNPCWPTVRRKSISGFTRLPTPGAKPERDRDVAGGKLA